MGEKSIPAAFAQGYALCTPTGVLLPHSFRRTQAEAIASVLTDADKRAEHWETAKQQGMTCEFVYVRVFPPRFFVSAALAALEAHETAGAA
ncbi:hypothetical protein ASE04_27595 [Rhizobium sp. Root708]|uniref:hypothetical protein n=1 Tax=Rhizobium sp. Root708 TaxID=1736592 RepID=UPI0006F8939E|nr:hypothetical protein [Rhizobium sp. Root708]KRB58480.1 hypothetical protein ASE04_27595 [Rhizobium sp. Root708]